MRILIFNPNEKGHHLIFLKLLIPAIRALGCDITLAITRQGFASEEFRTHLAPLSSQFQVDAGVIEPSNVGGRRQRMAEFVAAIKRNTPDHLIYPNAEPLLAALGVRAAMGRSTVPPRITAEYTLLRADFAYPPATLKQRAWYWAKERSISTIPNAAIYLVDPVAYGNIQRRGSSLAGKIYLLPDQLDNAAPISKSEARERLGIPVDGRYIGCTGVLSRRKGIDLLMRAFATADLSSADRLLLGGQIDPDIMEILTGEFAGHVREGRIVPLNRYLSDEELNWVICASDVVAATYLASQKSSSGIINRAAVFGRPVLASRFGWSDFMVPEFGLGTLTDIDNPSVFANDIAAALEPSAAFKQNPRVARYRDYLSPDNFTAAWTAGIARRMGRPIPELKTWQWVMQ